MRLAGKSVLVTGGCGYIGSHVTRQLSEAGYAVMVIDNLSTGFRDALVHDEKLLIQDLSDKERLGAAFAAGNFEAVLHFAASIVVPESVANPLLYYRNNTANLLGVLECCQHFGVHKLVFSSTAAVYGETGKSPVEEADPPAPTNPYARSKLMGEQMCMDLAGVSPFRYVILRYFNVAGADPAGRMGQRSPDATHLIKVACESAVGARQGITVYGNDYPTRDGTGVRDYIHVEDLASAHLAALSHLEKAGDNLLLNCGYGRGYSVLEVIDEIRRVSGGKFFVSQGPRRPGDVGELVADAHAIRRALSWTPRLESLAMIVAHALAWEEKLRARGLAGASPGEQYGSPIRERLRQNAVADLHRERDPGA